MTRSWAVKFARPAAFFAKHEYEPACCAFTTGMVKELDLSPAGRISTPERPASSRGKLFHIHEIFSGVSPLFTTHCTSAKSPELTNSSPNVKGKREGSTVMEVAEKFNKQHIKIIQSYKN